MIDNLFPFDIGVFITGSPSFDEAYRCNPRSERGVEKTAITQGEHEKRVP